MRDVASHLGKGVALLAALFADCSFVTLAKAEGGSSAPVAAVCRLHGAAFYDAAVDLIGWRTATPELSADELLQLTAKMAAENATQTDQSAHEYELYSLLDLACDAAGDQQVDGLSSIYAAALQPECLFRISAFSSLAKPWARRELRVIAREHRQVAFPVGGGLSTVPEALRNAPAPLLEAWTEYRRVTAPWKQTAERLEKQPWTVASDR